MAYYAALNTRANLSEGNRGFMNTWEIAQFSTRQARDAWVNDNENRLAEAVTRKDAERLWAGGYLCIGEPVPKGGLFRQVCLGNYRFYNSDQEN